MTSLDIIRAWKDLEYRNSLTDEQRALLPENPAGMIELTDTDLNMVAGGLPETISGRCEIDNPTVGVPCTGNWRSLYCCGDF